MDTVFRIMTSNNDPFMPDRLAEIVEDFQFVQGREKLEYLLQFAEELPQLPERFAERRDEMDEVHECMTPVFILAEPVGDRLDFYFDIPDESPTVRGFAGVLSEGLAGMSAADILRVPDEFYLAMGLGSVLSGQRLNGISAMLRHMKQLAAAHSAA